MPLKVDTSCYASPLSLRNKLGRGIWGVVWALLFRPTPRPFFGWRRFLLRCFGAKVGPGLHIQPTCKIWAPWNLELGAYVGIGHDVDLYSVDKIRIGAHATVSQYSYLCTASHDLADPHMRLLTAPITVGEGAWICADVFVAPGVTLGEGAVAAARAVVVKDVEPWTVVGGNPAKFIKTRVLEG